MANLKQWLIDASGDEPIEAVVIGEMGWGYASDRVPSYASQPRGKPLSWGEAEPYLDYEFDDGVGAPGCNAIYAWTPTKVIGISTYDGSTSLFVIPRHPCECDPEMPGGG